MPAREMSLPTTRFAPLEPSLSRASATGSPCVAANPTTKRSGYLSATALRMSAVGSDRKSTRLNSSHANISYAVFCLKKKKKKDMNVKIANEKTTKENIIVFLDDTTITTSTLHTIISRMTRVENGSLRRSIDSTEIRI